MKPSIDAVPPALSSMWRAVKRAHEAEPKLLAVSFSLTMLAALPDALLALWLKFLADGILSHRRELAIGSAIGLAVSAAATWFLRVISDRTQRRFRDRVTIALESHVAHLQAAVATIEHHERPEYLDRLAVLRNQIFVLDHMYVSLFATCGWVLRLGVTIALLMSIHPALALLALFALPTVLTSTWRPGVERAAEERGASANRLARHLFDVATTARAGKRSSRDAHRRSSDRGSPLGMGTMVRAGRRGEAQQRLVVLHRVGHLRSGLCRRDRFRDLRAQSVGGRYPATACRRIAAVLVRGRGGRRDWIPPRHLAGRLAQARVA